MAISEMYLDSEQERNSIVSHAKELNYLPRSRRSAKANVTINITATQAGNFLLFQKIRRLTASVVTQHSASLQRKHIQQSHHRYYNVTARVISFSYHAHIRYLV